MRNALTIDVEDYYHVSLARRFAEGKWDAFEDRVGANTRRMLDLCDEAGVRATCFVLGWVAEKHPDLVREIARRGHEIACHGFWHRLIYEDGPDRFRDDVSRSKHTLEDLSGGPVLGYRAASFSIVASTRWALDALLDLGFVYDASIYPIRHDLYGIPDAPTEPARIRTPSGREIVEFPGSTVRFLGKNRAIGGGGWFRLLPYRFVARGIRRMNEREGRPYGLYIHPWEIDPDQPRMPLRRLARFRHYVHLRTTEAKLRRLLAEFAFAPMAEVLRERGLIA